jgi:nucleoid-associated protein YgaU
MTDTTHRPEPAGGESTGRTAQVTPTLGSRVGPTGFGSGPLLAAGIMFGGAVIFAGWGVTQMAMADDATPGGSAEPVVSVPAGPSDESGTGTRGDRPDGNGGTGTVTLPDDDGNGVPDEYEEHPHKPGKGDGETPGSEPTEDEGNHQRKPAPETEPAVYVIEHGDTLAGISGETGVPIDVLIKENKIQNPNLIFAGASLLIPPA